MSFVVIPPFPGVVSVMFQSRYTTPDCAVTPLTFSMLGSDSPNETILSPGRCQGAQTVRKAGVFDASSSSIES